jgi:hypothetical protein
MIWCEREILCKQMEALLAFRSKMLDDILHYSSCITFRKTQEGIYEKENVLRLDLSIVCKCQRCSAGAGQRSKQPEALTP